jgi:hypothetical protein
MFTKNLTKFATRSNNFMPMAVRGVYAPGTEPAVFINEHTKLLV